MRKVARVLSEFLNAYILVMNSERKKTNRKEK